MKVYAIYNKTNRFIAAFPDREDAINYGIVMFGKECGWEYDIREMFLYEIPQYQFLQPIQQIPVPYTKPIPCTTVKPPYEQHIWTCKDGPTTTYPTEREKYPSEHISAVGIEGLQGPKKIHSFPVDSGPFAPGTK